MTVCRFAEDIKYVVIAGAGLMGSSIAQIFARYGYQVCLYDIAEKFLDKSRNLITLNLETCVKERELTDKEANAVLSRIHHTCEKQCFKACDFVIEAILETLEVKQTFWKEISDLVPDDTILTTNTSGLHITDIAKAVKKPERFAGMHWVNPPHIVPLVEVINGEKTAPETTEAVYGTAKKIGKKPVIVKKDANGFILNRIQFSILREALNIVESGIASYEDVDNVMKYGLGMRYACLGPFEIADFGGLDTFYNISTYLFADLSDSKKGSSVLSKLTEQGNLGVKSGKGFYDYSGGKDKDAIKYRDEMYIKIAKCLYGNIDFTK